MTNSLHIAFFNQWISRSWVNDKGLWVYWLDLWNTSTEIGRNWGGGLRFSNSECTHTHVSSSHYIHMYVSYLCQAFPWCLQNEDRRMPSSEYTLCMCLIWFVSALPWFPLGEERQTPLTSAHMCVSHPFLALPLMSTGWGQMDVLCQTVPRSRALGKSWWLAICSLRMLGHMSAGQPTPTHSLVFREQLLSE